MALEKYSEDKTEEKIGMFGIFMGKFKSKSDKVANVKEKERQTFKDRDLKHFEYKIKPHAKNYSYRR